MIDINSLKDKIDGFDLLENESEKEFIKYYNVIMGI